MKLGIVDRWHEALGAGAVDEVVRLTAHDVEIRGPRGTAHGHAVLRAWAGGAGARLEPVRWYCGPRSEVVVAQRASWAAGDGNRPDTRTPAVELATRFSVRKGLIARIERHDVLADALAAGGLSASDEVGLRG